MSKLCFGVDLGGTTVKMGLFDGDRGLLENWEIKTRKENGGSLILGDIAEAISDKIAEKGLEKDEIAGIGIGVPGPVLTNGVVNTCVNLGWKEVDVVKELTGRTGLPVMAANDANVAALGEMWKGGGAGHKTLVMMTLGTGVGGGIILNEKIWAGTNGAGGEIGHMHVVYEEEESCNCGNKGCLEQVASATGIVKEAKKLLSVTDRPSSLREKEEVTAKDIFDAAKQGDELAAEVTEKLGKYLGIAAAHISAVIDPEIFVIGGGVSKAGEVLINLIQKYYKEKVFYGSADAEFALAKLGNDAGIYGAARMILG